MSELYGIGSPLKRLYNVCKAVPFFPRLSCPTLYDFHPKIGYALQLAVPSIAPLMCGQTAAMLQACESSDQFKASLEEEHRSMSQFHIDCVQVGLTLSTSIPP